MSKIILDQQEFEYTIEFKKTRILKLRFKDGKINVVSPYFISNLQIQEFIFSHSTFILKQAKKYQLLQNKLEIHELDTITLLGKKYQIIFSNSRSIIKNQIVFIHNEKKDNIRKELKRLFKPFQEEIFVEKTKSYFQRMYNSKNEPTIKIKDVKSKWGSYNRLSHEIIYSSELIFKPIETYDYIVVHELAHISEFNHSKQFYEVVKMYCPNYKELRKILKDVSV